MCVDFASGENVGLTYSQKKYHKYVKNFPQVTEIEGDFLIGEGHIL